MIKKVVALALFCLLTSPAALLADTVKGRIKYISNKASTIQLDVKDSGSVVVRFDGATQYENTKGIQELLEGDLISVDYEAGKPAARISKVTFGLPPGVEIDIQEMLAVLQGKRGAYLLVDARPKPRYLEGHIPSAITAFPGNKEEFLAALPRDKASLIVFYCGGPTCPFTGDSIEIATAAGYTNLKGFQEGIPGWKKNNLPLHSNRGWLAANLDQHHVILDVRPPAASAAQHIQGAVSLPADRLKAMTEAFVRNQKVARLEGVADKTAPIVVYADSHSAAEVISAYRELRGWGYKNATVLEGGLKAWAEEGLPTETGQAATEIHYTKRLAEGAIPAEEFVALTQAPEGTVFVDVRQPEELAAGSIKGALHIPLDQLESRMGELPKDKAIITYCENGIRAEMAYQALKKAGFKTRFLDREIDFESDGSFKL